MQPLRRNTTLPIASPAHSKFSRAASYYDWVKGAIWDGPDEWRDQSKIDRYKISAVEHNKPFVEVIKERSGYDFSEISAFMDRNPGLLHWEHDTLCVEAFCQGADEILDNPVQDRAQDNQLTKENGPEAWVSDRNYWLSQDGIAQEHWYGQVLDRLGFYQVLKNEVRGCERFIYFLSFKSYILTGKSSVSDSTR